MGCPRVTSTFSRQFRVLCHGPWVVALMLLSPLAPVASRAQDDGVPVQAADALNNDAQAWLKRIWPDPLAEPILAKELERLAQQFELALSEAQRVGTSDALRLGTFRAGCAILKLLQSDYPGAIAHCQAGLASGLGVDADSQRVLARLNLVWGRAAWACYETEVAYEKLLTARAAFEAIQPKQPTADNEYVVTLVELAKVQTSLGHYVDAQRTFELALKDSTITPPQRALVLECWGSLFCAMGDYRKCDDLRAEWQRILAGSGRLARERFLLNLAGAVSFARNACLLGDLSQAEKLLNREQDVRLIEDPCYRWLKAEYWLVKARLALGREELREALLCWEKARNFLPAEEHFLCGELHLLDAMLSNACGQRTAAIRSCYESIACYEAACGDVCPQLGEPLLELLEARVAIGADLQTVEMLCDRILSISTLAAYGPGLPHHRLYIGRTLHLRGRHELFNRNRKDSTRALFDQANHTLESMGNPRHPAIYALRIDQLRLDSLSSDLVLQRRLFEKVPALGQELQTGRDRFELGARQATTAGWWALMNGRRAAAKVYFDQACVFWQRLENKFPDRAQPARHPDRAEIRLGEALLAAAQQPNKEDVASIIHMYLTSDEEIPGAEVLLARDHTPDAVAYFEGVRGAWLLEHQQQQLGCWTYRQLVYPKYWSLYQQDPARFKIPLGTVMQTIENHCPGPSPNAADP
ncbi:MAG: hypothetical protein K1X74_16610 [Pirellulales bacterium]|nr:hypothetical protein [Pirellulales bacterium]